MIEQDKPQLSYVGECEMQKIEMSVDLIFMTSKLITQNTTYLCRYRVTNSVDDIQIQRTQVTRGNIRH